MMGMKKLLQLCCFLLTGVRCAEDSHFVYGRVGGDTLLPCAGLDPPDSPDPPDCSLVTWTFAKGSRYTAEVSGGELAAESHLSGRMSVTPDCSLVLRELTKDDAAAYICQESGKHVVIVYLSLLAITSTSSVSDLRPGGSLALSCILFTYYDVGSCKSYSSLNLSWTTGDGALLPRDSRYELIDRSRCNISLVTTLRREDSNRKWRCQVNASDRRLAFLDFRSTFLFENPPADQDRSAAAVPSCPVHLPVSRMALCVALPIMVVIVGLFTRRGNRKSSKTAAAAIELQESG